MASRGVRLLFGPWDQPLNYHCLVPTPTQNVPAPPDVFGPHGFAVPGPRIDPAGGIWLLTPKRGQTGYIDQTELITAGLGNKTVQGMGHIAMSGDRGAIAALDGLDIGQKVFLHINNSNPALLPASPERELAERAGWQFATDGTEIVL